MNQIKNNQSIAEFVSPQQLPGVLSEIAEAMGTKTALIISDEFGGMGIYIARWTEDKSKRGRIVSTLIECIGENAAKKISLLRGGSHITIPSCKNLILKMRDRAICAEVSRGVKRDEIVRKYGISDRRIRSIVSASSRQPIADL